MGIQVESSIVINRPIEDVFAFCADESNTMKWQADVSESTADGPPGVGTTLTEVRHVMGREMRSRVQMTEYDPPYRLGFKVLDGPVQFEGLQTFEAVEGGTLVTLNLTGEPGGFFSVAAPLLQAQVKKSSDRDFATLKSLLES